MKRKTLWGLVFASLLIDCNAFAQNAPAVDPVKLMQQVEKQASSDDEVVQIAMQLTDSSGKTSNRKATYYRKRRDSGSLADLKLIRFSSPAELNGSAVLTLENADRADDQWLYLPAYRTSRKIPSSNRSDRYMGTDFFYEDVSNDKISQYKYTVTGQQKISGRMYVLIEQTPQEEEVKRESAYGKKMQWVDPERFIVTRIDYYDKQGGLIKRMEANSPIQMAGHWRWSEMVMSDLRSNHKTSIQYSERKIDAGLDPSLFSVRNLERFK